MEMKTKFDERIAISSSQINKLEREKNDISIKRPALRNAINESIGEISKLQTEEEVNELIHCQYWYLVWNVVVICLWFKLQAHKSLKNEQDTCIQNIFSSYNLGSLPKPPFSAADGLNLTNRIKSRLRDLEKDLEDKKVTLLFALFGYIFTFKRLWLDRNWEMEDCKWWFFLLVDKASLLSSWYSTSIGFPCWIFRVWHSLLSWC